jgi:hypothetical protein
MGSNLQKCLALEDTLTDISQENEAVDSLRTWHMEGEVQEVITWEGRTFLSQM